VGDLVVCPCTSFISESTEHVIILAVNVVQQTLPIFRFYFGSLHYIEPRRQEMIGVNRS
jgi:hypothetical protein